MFQLDFPDAEAHNEFLQLKAQLTNERRKVQSTMGMLTSLSQSSQRDQLTLNHLKAVAEAQGSDTRTFRVVGRMYIETDMPTMQKSLEEAIEKSKHEVERLKETKASQEQSAVELEKLLHQAIEKYKVDEGEDMSGATKTF
ncbi:hypothetical protein H696_05241 [Fonticula alba]|uniref:Prefoldin subunit 1 n=1 Tax=Fonticula alba TaxID=691883 RepID=A0A058Z213_FONAL|nr:hypothetical protein H696_05241 [Fonticula alba]KCV68324.1 hypothetical protein H696_05241 [Fonticula alba]|eukprot:XP_009497378.1 hypothetical protein H696_05241 [Fonticula alba]